MKTFTNTMMVKTGFAVAVALLMAGTACDAWAQSNGYPNGYGSRRSTTSTSIRYQDGGPTTVYRRSYDHHTGEQHYSYRHYDQPRRVDYHGPRRDDGYRGYRETRTETRVISTPHGVYRVKVEKPVYRHADPVYPVRRPEPRVIPVHHDWHHRDFRSIDEARAFAVSLHLPKVQIKAFKQNGSFHVEYWRN